jgi:hypothetical protein
MCLTGKESVGLAPAGHFGREKAAAKLLEAGFGR